MIKLKCAIDVVVRYFKITIACLVYATAVALFLNPKNIAPGGVSGAAIILKSIFPWIPSIGLVIIILNIPILIIGAIRFGAKFLVSTIYSVIATSLLIDIIPNVINPGLVAKDMMICAITGGVLLGMSMGILFRLEATTGGFDIIIKLIRQSKPHIKTGQMFVILDIVVLMALALSFKDIQLALYATISIYISSLFMDKTLYGSDQATLVYIISEKRKEISEKIVRELHFGSTLIKALGAYNFQDTEIILCVMKKQHLIKVRNMVKETDPKAFMVVSQANEVFGEGFKDHNKAEV